MKVTSFHATCKDCHAKFDNPLLSDMSYGKFITGDQKGNGVTYLTAIGNPSWDRIDQLFQKVFPKQNVLSGSVCPNCHGTNVRYEDGIRTGELDLPNATFSKCLALEDLTQEQRINELCSQWLEQPTKR